METLTFRQIAELKPGDAIHFDVDDYLVVKLSRTGKGDTVVLWGDFQTDRKRGGSSGVYLTYLEVSLNALLDLSPEKKSRELADQLIVGYREWANHAAQLAESIKLEGEKIDKKTEDITTNDRENKIFFTKEEGIINRAALILKGKMVTLDHHSPDKMLSWALASGAKTNGLGIHEVSKRDYNELLEEYPEGC